MSPIFSLYHSEEQVIKNLLKEETENPPFIEFTDRKGVVNRLWKINDNEKINQLAERMQGKQIFIADGHHRYETALHFQEKKGNGVADHVMMTFVDISDPGLMILPTHRLILPSENSDPKKLLSDLKGYFSVEEKNKNELFKEMNQMDGEKVFGFYSAKRFYLLKLMNNRIMNKLMPDKPDSLKNLNVSVLHSLILDKIMGIDKEKVKQQRHVSFVKSKLVAIRAVDNGYASAAFFLNPTKIEEVNDIAMADEKMPQKSTYFFPKLLSGMIINKFG